MSYCEHTKPQSKSCPTDPWNPSMLWCEQAVSNLMEHAADAMWCREQVLAGQECSEKADIWSLGVVLWEIVTGERPHLRQLRPLRCLAYHSPPLHICLCMRPDLE